MTCSCFRALLLACCAVIGCQEKLRTIVSVDLAGFFFRFAAIPPKTALAVAYLLHEPSVEVLALAAGFGESRTWYQQLLLRHPCKAAETFLADLKRKDVPVVCGLAAGNFLQRSPLDALEELMAGGNEAAWLVLDSMTAAAAVTLPSLKSSRRISEFVFAGPGLRWFGAEPSAFGAAGLMLRGWQDSFTEAAPRLRLVRMTGNSTVLDKEMKRCRGSWMTHHFLRAPVVTTIQKHMSVMFMASTLSTTGSFMSSSLLGILNLVFPQDQDAPLLAAALVAQAEGCAAVSLGGQIQVSPESCRQEKREDPPDTLYVKLQDMTDTSHIRVVDTLCDVALPKVAEEL
ncbi:unnamed protein product [Symbiodinium natans]|uniref:Uncharacterized protein n=1 Tax=Symbiodinium natans TaxID=878477 RepID=A0A812IFH9_9DINO|nr:unnamed protein product [Symbiodinium natans]